MSEKDDSGDHHAPDYRELIAHGRPTTAVVTLGEVPIRVFGDEETAHEWIDGLPRDPEGLSVWWPVESPEVADDE